MTDEEKKAWDFIVSDTRRCYSNYDCKYYCKEHSEEKIHDDAILAADAELTALREEVRLLKIDVVNVAMSNTALRARLSLADRVVEAINKVIRNSNSIETKIEFGSGRTTIVCANFLWDGLRAALRAYDEGRRGSEVHTRAASDDDRLRLP